MTSTSSAFWVSDAAHWFPPHDPQGNGVTAIFTAMALAFFLYSMLG